ncbi:MAG: type II/IV secretion system protein [Verrucomicrobiales bacterium]|nr:type II/IV secretion system protein [Verrucomicrobiales bacterium]
MLSATPTPRLGDWLLDEGYLQPAQLDLALREQKRGGKLLGEALVDLGFVSREVLSRFLAEKTQSDAVHVSRLVVPPEILDLVPQDLARRFLALPLSREGNTLQVAIADPLNVTAFDLLEQVTGLRVNLAAASAHELLSAIDRLYQSRQSVDQIVDELLQLDRDQLANTTEKDAPTIRLVDRIIQEAVNLGASDIHVHPEEKVLRVRLRRDGVLDPGFLLPKQIQPALIARFKILGGMDIAENRRTQDGRGKVTISGRDVGLRFSSLPTSFGESLVLRILDRGMSTQDIAALGFAPALERNFRALVERPHGVIFVTGPTGSGKTTTLYAALGLIDGSETSIFTLEDPVEFQLPGVRQTQINETIGLTFADGLRTLLRQDPDVILVGETRDTETAQLVTRAALTGHLVFSSLHTNDALAALPRLVDLGVAPYLLAPTLAGILGQRLVRRLCPQCRQPSQPPRRLLESLGKHTPAGTPAFHQPVGCPHCRGTGFRGRLGVHELVTVEATLQKAIAANADAHEMNTLAHAQGFQTMLDDGIAKAAAGLTTVEEVLRATGS